MAAAKSTKPKARPCSGSRDPIALLRQVGVSKHEDPLYLCRACGKLVQSMPSNKALRGHTVGTVAQRLQAEEFYRRLGAG